MLLCIDLGNTRAKAALFKHDDLEQLWPNASVAELIQLANGMPTLPIMVGAVGNQITHFYNLIENKQRLTLLNANTRLPFTNLYHTPQTLGADRIAAVAGAHHLYPNTPLLVIDAGTCITYDFIDDQAQYWGGSIAPGVQMSYRALHEFTAKLPLIESVAYPAPLTGTDTKSAIQSGVQNGILFQIKGFVSEYQSKYKNLKIVACGGDEYLFNQIPNCHYIANLVLMGLSIIWKFNFGTVQQ